MADSKLPATMNHQPSAISHQPFSAWHGPCLRCWIYPRASPEARYCVACQTILDEAWGLYPLSRRAVVIWGCVTQLPRQLQPSDEARDSSILGAYVHDENRFLLMLHHRALQPWLQELAIYHGGDIKGMLQIVHSTHAKDMLMGELLCRMVHEEARFPADRLRVRFFAAPHQIFSPGYYEREGVLTFEASEFLRMLDMAVVFRTMMPPHEQKILYKLLTMEDTREEQFYWGRLLGVLTPEAKDMLSAWKIRLWTKSQVNLFYALVEYVGFYQPG